ncbi:carbohydrate sulfotransferase 11-like [Nasonia vitripennis]|uniref:Carbohydrate sulfotransferase n=1 Tax=Nasonia vitripennis TaxID=7425 RepID=A0A7M7Q642_NASVI|nr:carbohydrate sulfotransferase 11-like [Nasonia vitripennis]
MRFIRVVVNRITMSRTLRRNVPKFLVLFTVGALFFLLLVRSKLVRSYDEPEYKKQDTERAKREAEIENRERIARVRRVCKKYQMGPFKTASSEVEFKEPPAPQYSVFYIDSKHNISYCPIYKSGSTTWIYNLCLLNGVSEKELSSGKEQISVIARRIIPELDYPEADVLLSNTAKLLIVRHPFERLLSAYRDKLENSVAGREHGSLHFYKRYGESIVRKYRDKNRPTPSSNQVIRRAGLPAPAGIEPTWREFVDYLINTDLASYADDHWTPYYLYCTPCLINYDIIAKVETLWRDQAYAIHQLGLDQQIRPRWRHSTSNNVTDAATVYFSQLTKEHVRKLHEKFRLDLEMFGYDAERYYELATATS